MRRPSLTATILGSIAALALACSSGGDDDSSNGSTAGSAGGSTSGAAGTPHGGDAGAAPQGGSAGSPEGGAAGAPQGGGAGSSQGGAPQGGGAGSSQGGAPQGGGAGAPQGGKAGSSQGGKAGASQGGSAGSAPGEPSGKMSGMVAAHNEARDGVSPPAATPIPHVTWNNTAAASASSWAKGCKFEHDPALGSLKQGQNLYAQMGSNPTAKDVVKSWVSEDKNYDYASNKCAAGKVCGHYTQVVWAKTTGIGCAVETCPAATSPFGGKSPWELWVCNYIPPGNYTGQKPY